MKEIEEIPEAFGSSRNPYLTNGLSLWEQKCNPYILRLVFITGYKPSTTSLGLKLLSCKSESLHKRERERELEDKKIQ